MSLPPELYLDIARDLTYDQVVQMCKGSRALASECRNQGFWREWGRTQSQGYLNATLGHAKAQRNSEAIKRLTWAGATPVKGLSKLHRRLMRVMADPWARRSSVPDWVNYSAMNKGLERMLHDYILEVETSEDRCTSIEDLANDVAHYLSPPIVPQTSVVYGDGCDRCNDRAFDVVLEILTPFFVKLGMTAESECDV